MKWRCRVEADVDLLRVERGRLFLTDEDQSGKLDEAGVEVEDIGRGAVGLRGR